MENNMAGMDANLSIAAAKAQQNRTCAGGNEQSGGSSNSGSGSKPSKSMKKMETMTKEKEG